MRNCVFVIVVPLLFLAGCTSIKVRPVSAEYHMQHACIQQNPKVLVDDFIPVLQEGFGRHGITTEVCLAGAPVPCEYTVTYTALKTWDMATYLSHAEVRVNKDSEEIGSAVYHLTGTGGLSLMKWKGTKEKMDPAIDELLQNY